MNALNAETDELCFTSAVELSHHIRRRELSPVELIQAVLDRISTVDPLVNAYVTVCSETALEQARSAEQELMRRSADDLPPLFGLPVSVKDLIDTAGVRTTYGSRHYADHVPTADGGGWARLKAAGGILIGKTTTPEFGALGVTESPLTGVTNNPWRLDRTAGGSSGGAAAAVAAGMGPLAWGSDGGGSIRIPAACCGVVGLKASIGRIDGAGEREPFGSVETSGPITRTVLDTALMLSVTSGLSPRDPLSMPAFDVDVIAEVSRGLEPGLRVGYSVDLGQARVSAATRDIVDGAVTKFSDLGAQVETIGIDIPDAVQYFLDYWSPLIVSTYDELVARGSADPDSHPMAGTFRQVAAEMTAVDLARTSSVTRRATFDGLMSAFDRHDILVTPTMPLTAFPHPGDIGGNTEVDGVAVRLPAIDFHRLTEPMSHAGLPAISVPCGFDTDGMPVGLQIVGPPRADLLVLRVAHAFEQISNLTRHRPEFLTASSPRGLR